MPKLPFSHIWTHQDVVGAVLFSCVYELYMIATCRRLSTEDSRGVSCLWSTHLSVRWVWRLLERLYSVSWQRLLCTPGTKPVAPLQRPIVKSHTSKRLSFPFQALVRSSILSTLPLTLHDITKHAKSWARDGHDQQTPYRYLAIFTSYRGPSHAMLISADSMILIATPLQKRKPDIDYITRPPSVACCVSICSLQATTFAPHAHFLPIGLFSIFVCW